VLNRSMPKFVQRIPTRFTKHKMTPIILLGLIGCMLFIAQAIFRRQRRERSLDHIPTHSFADGNNSRQRYLHAAVVLLLVDIVQNLPLPPLTANICIGNPPSTFPRTLILFILWAPSRRIRSQSLPVHLGGLSLATTLVAMHQTRQQ
jgi:hypothetical protein